MQTKTTAEGHTTKRAEYHRVRVAAAAKRRRAEIVSVIGCRDAADAVRLYSRQT